MTPLMQLQTLTDLYLPFLTRLKLKTNDHQLRSIFMNERQVKSSSFLIITIYYNKSRPYQNSQRRKERKEVTRDLW